VRLTDQFSVNWRWRLVCGSLEVRERDNTVLRDRFNTPTVDRQTEALIEAIRAHSYQLQNRDDLSPLIELIGDAQFVLVGEASHGTSEYYQWRTRLSQRLIEEKGFSFIAVEGDCPCSA
jgi:erythromycin esterase-like protein